MHFRRGVDMLKKLTYQCTNNLLISQVWNSTEMICLIDPLFALGELQSLQKRAEKAIEFEFESRKFKESCDELKIKVQELKNYGIS